jgi:hypothetical protein
MVVASAAFASGGWRLPMQIHRQVNSTPHPVAIAFCQDTDGRDLALALLKASFRFTPKGEVTLAEPADRLPIHLHDVYFGEPASSSLRYASDVVPAKLGTDIVVNGSVHAGNRGAVRACVRVGGLSKQLIAFGPRQWLDNTGQRMSQPDPFLDLPLRYEHAFGGSYVGRDGQSYFYGPNPIGVGFRDSTPARSALPQLEDERALIRSPQDRPAPASLGFVPSGWPQRSAFAGTFDETWSKTRRPLLPTDFDPRFYNSVPQDQVLRPGLQGGEPVVLEHLHPESLSASFSLPSPKLVAKLAIKDRVEEVPMHADTLVIEPDRARIAITFRSTCLLGDDFRFLKTVFWNEVA